MSWNIHVVAPYANKEALKARVRAEHMPALIEHEIIRRIEGVSNAYNGQHADKLAISVRSYGHFDEANGPYGNMETFVMEVRALPFIDTPLPAAQPQPTA